MTWTPLEESEHLVTRYRGKHRAPSLVDTVVDNSGRAAAAVVTTGVLAAVPTVMTTPVASAAESGNQLAAIAFCESTNVQDAVGPVTSAGGHFGLFQFDLDTWHSVGGKGNPKNATVAEQYFRANLLMQQRGTQPWNASKDCWQGKTSVKGPVLHSKRSSGKTAAQSDVGKRRAGTAIPDGYRVVSGDTLGKLAKRFHVDGGSNAIAAANGIKNPDRIFVGQTLN